MARPKKQIDLVLVERLASIHCTNEEIAAMCECSADTIERRFAGVIKEARNKGKSSLRRMQWQAALKGNIGMMIWLGKQLLGQKEPREQTVIEAKVDGKTDIVIRWTDEPDPGTTQANSSSEKV